MTMLPFPTSGTARSVLAALDSLGGRGTAQEIRHALAADLQPRDIALVREALDAGTIVLTWTGERPTYRRACDVPVSAEPEGARLPWEE